MQNRPVAPPDTIEHHTTTTAIPSKATELEVLSFERIDRPPTRRLALFNATGVLVALSSPLIVERNLSTLIIKFTPASMWEDQWAFVSTTAAGLTALLTYLCLDKHRAGGRNVWVAPLIAMLPIIGLSLTFRWGKWPHIGMWCWAFGFGVLAHVVVVCRKARNMTPTKTNREGARATLSTWQMITVYSLTAYLAFVVFQLYLVWLMAEPLVESPQERLLFFGCSASQLVVFSALIFMGPLREAWQMTFESIQRLAAEKETYVARGAENGDRKAAPPAGADDKPQIVPSQQM